MRFSSGVIWLTVTVLVLCFSSCTSLPSSRSKRAADPVCGYQSCHAVDPTKLNVHLVPHTHDDVGWLNTFDQYYYGSGGDIYNPGVQYILDTVVATLSENSDRRFIYVETAFFWKWWLQQNEEIQDLVKTLVNEGRLEFIGGAWSMNDEASTHHYSIIDQFTWGLRKLNDTFGACGQPRVGWQVDTYGHSREMASIFARMGYDGLIVGRLDYLDRESRRLSKTLDMIWEGSPNLGSAADLFTSTLYTFYSPPTGFCFDIKCSDPPIIDDVTSPEYNVDQRVQEFINYIRGHSSYYETNNIILTMGGDFFYQDAVTWFENMDKLIRYTNEADSSVNVIYSTPSCYLKAVNDDGVTFTTKQDDFFPYAIDPNSYWTGCYTSRPTNKYYERLANNFLQVSKQLEAMTGLGQVGDSQLDRLREAMGIMQHHHAITGTEKQAVADDYIRLLTVGMEEAMESAKLSLNQLMSGTESSVEIQNCLLLNVSYCPESESQGDHFVVTVYNPLSHSVNHPVRVPVPAGTYTVQDPSGDEVAIQLVPIPESVLGLPERAASIATHDLVFRAENLPPLGFRSYFFTRNGISMEEVQPSSGLTIGDANLQVELDENTGLVKTIFNNGETVNLDQNFYYYEAFNGNNMELKNRSSGAFTFRPVSTSVKQVADLATSVIYKGEIVDEIHQTFSPWLTQVVRIYKEENYVEFEWLVGPIPIDDGVGKEVISRFTTDFATDGFFYTDSNGREIIERRRNFRPTYETDILEPVAGNYYPVPTTVLIRDEAMGQELAVLTDRGQGGSSLNDGQIELMVHRRLVHDDGFGIGEALNEEAYGQGLVVRGKHYVVAGAIAGSPSLRAQERDLAQRKLLSPWSFFSVGDPSFETWSSNYKMEFSGLTTSLPTNIQIHTLEPWKDSTLLLRLEHILELNDDSELSQPVAVSYEDIFATFTITSSHETTLAANQWLEDMNRLSWTSASARKVEQDSKRSARAIDAVTLGPMEMGTYVINVAKR